MQLEDTQYQSVLYFMSRFTINAGGKSFDVPRNMIAGIEIAKNFETHIYPLFYISVNIPIWLNSEINKDPNNVTVNMLLQYKLNDATEKDFYSSGGLNTEISGNFKVSIPNVTQETDSKLQNELTQKNGDYGENYTFNEYAMIEMCLYNPKAWAASFNKLNAILTSTNMTDALTYCLQSCGISNVLLNNSENYSVYKEFKILPESGIKNILRIIEDYKFHSDGSIVFFDLLQSYILNKKVGCTAWKNNEYKMTMFECRTNLSDGLAGTSGVYINTKDKYYKIAFEKNSYSVEPTDASPLLQQSGNSDFILIRTPNAVMEMLTPNKEFVMSIEGEGSKFNGKYRLYSYILSLVPNGEFFKCDYKIYLRK